MRLLGRNPSHAAIMTGVTDTRVRVRRTSGSVGPCLLYGRAASFRRDQRTRLDWQRANETVGSSRDSGIDRRLCGRDVLLATGPVQQLLLDQESESPGFPDAEPGLLKPTSSLNLES